MKIGLFIGSTAEIRGPYKVAHNLLLGLSKIDIQVNLNKIEQHTGCLISGIPDFYNLPRNTLMGPNLVVLPSDDSAIWSLYKNFVVPSQWVYDLYKLSCFPTAEANISVWPVGIDTDRFNDLNRKNNCDCLIYLKGRALGELGDFLSSRGISYDVITYGSYSEEEFLQKIKNCKFCILHTGTESQGIAYMEILSSGLPCFVLNVDNWNGVPASSVPYFSDQCGKISGPNLQAEFQEFIVNIDKYSPRQYILDHHTLEKSAYRYIEIMEDRNK